jgi:hypothetical protein
MSEQLLQVCANTTFDLLTKTFVILSRNVVNKKSEAMRFIS